MRGVYAFEEIADDLPRPPLAALRAMTTSGIAASPRGWASLPIDTRVRLVEMGAAEVVDAKAVSDLMSRVPVEHVRLVPKTGDPDRSAVPQDIVRSLAPVRPITD